MLKYVIGAAATLGAAVNDFELQTFSNDNDNDRSDLTDSLTLLESGFYTHSCCFVSNDFFDKFVTGIEMCPDSGITID